MTPNSDDNNQRCTPKSKPEFPWILPIGQKVTWEEYPNGTQEIRLSANGKAAFSPDNVLTILQLLEKAGFGGPEWKCISLELNIEGRNHRIDFCYRVDIIKGLLFKVYQHGPNMRLELADHRKHTIPEVVSFLNAFLDKLDGADALKEVRRLEPEMREVKKIANTALNITRKR